MDGVAVMVQLLTNDSDVTALVAATRIQAGALPQGVTLPAIAIETISKVDRNIPNPGIYRHVSERVQVTVLAKNYPSQKDVMRAVREAAADTFPTVTGLINVTVHTDGAGPDLMSEESSIYIGTQDFRITYSEERQPASS